MADDEIADLFTDKGCEVRGYDFVHVAVADDETVAIGNGDAGDGVTVFWGYGWCLERSEVEEYHDLGLT